MVPARCKLAYIRSGIIAIIRSAATGLISIEKVSNNPDEEAGFKKMFPRTYRPTPQDCASAQREQNLHRYVIHFTPETTPQPTEYEVLRASAIAERERASQAKLERVLDYTKQTMVAYMSERS